MEREVIVENKRKLIKELRSTDGIVNKNAIWLLEQEIKKLEPVEDPTPPDTSGVIENDTTAETLEDPTPPEVEEEPIIYPTHFMLKPTEKNAFTIMDDDIWFILFGVPTLTDGERRLWAILYKLIYGYKWKVEQDNRSNTTQKNWRVRNISTKLLMKHTKMPISTLSRSLYSLQDKRMLKVNVVGSRSRDWSITINTDWTGWDVDDDIKWLITYKYNTY